MLDPFHPDLTMHARLPRRTLTMRTVKLIRFLERWQRPTKHAPEIVRLDADVTLRVFRPPGERARPGLLWIHGGGMVLGTAKQDDQLCRRITDELGIVVAAVDYRLAPENPYPAPLEDCYAAMRWLSHQPGVERVAVGGASAGGGLAAGVALAARDRGEIDLAAQLLFYPMIDDRSGHRDDLDARPYRPWTAGSNRLGWSAYLADTTDVSPYAAPARAIDLTGLPPTWIGVGTNDLFHDEDRVYAAALRDAGVDVREEIVSGAYHGFDAVEVEAPIARHFRASAIDFLRTRLL